MPPGPMPGAGMPAGGVDGGPAGMVGGQMTALAVAEREMEAMADMFQ